MKKNIERKGRNPRITVCYTPDENEKIVFMRARVIGILEHECVSVFVNNEEAILNGTFSGSLVDHISDVPCRAYRHC